MRKLTGCFLGFASVILLQTGCTIKATTQQIFDTTSNITASTSGRIWWNEDGLLHPEHKAIAFATINRANLEQDMARGQGEYLSSFGTLLGVPEESYSRFTAKAQGDFSSWLAADHAGRLRHLRTAHE